MPYFVLISLHQHSSYFFFIFRITKYKFLTLTIFVKKKFVGRRDVTNKQISFVHKKSIKKDFDEWRRNETFENFFFVIYIIKIPQSDFMAGLWLRIFWWDFTSFKEKNYFSTGKFVPEIVSKSATIAANHPNYI